MPLTEGQKTEIRRLAGYTEPGTPLNRPTGPPYAPSFGQMGHVGDRFVPENMALEYRLSENLPETAEVAILGADSPAFAKYLAAASVTVALASAGDVVAGEDLALRIAGTMVHVSTGSSLALTAVAIAAGVNGADAGALVYAQPGPASVTLTALEPGTLANNIGVVAFGSPSVQLTVTDPADGTPTTNLRGGKYPPGPRYTTSTTPPLVIVGHLHLCLFWEDAVATASEGMDTIRAGSFTQDRAEYSKRKTAFVEACRDLCQTLAVPYRGGIDYRGNSRRRRTGA